ncbi:GTPase HflX [invertebrate metagenome]|uniref:GTPase HflX n=1 Tax=invertebrate metagenome TaxID=1711999 RepID=A0A2H9T7M0_9ZZZZ
MYLFSFGRSSLLFSEQTDERERAVLVHLNFNDELEREDPHEFKELARSAGVDIVDFVEAKTFQPNPRFFVGPGKVEEIRKLVVLHEADVVLFNHALSPSQERNLEGELEAGVIDRTRLILDIFAQRARTFEGKLQVELAQLEHLSTRLVRGWTHLERQKGGIGLRGPGETQLETDRRLLRVRIRHIQKRLEKVRSQREQGRRSRKRSEMPLVSIVGYTNAGKSTLFNTLTNSSVYSADQLFATLDPTLRQLPLNEVGTVILADTVGFIRHLPHKLVESFRATLEETSQADLLLHIIDCQDPERMDNMAQVHRVLDEIDAQDIPVLEVFNKIDLHGSVEAQIQRNSEGFPVRVWISAMTGEGLDLLRQAITEVLSGDMLQGKIVLSPDQGKVRSLLYQQGAVQQETINEQGQFVLDVKMKRYEFDRLVKRRQISEKTLVIDQP